MPQFQIIKYHNHYCLIVGCESVPVGNYVVEKQPEIFEFLTPAQGTKLLKKLTKDHEQADRALMENTSKRNIPSR